MYKSILLFILIVDQLTKYWASAFLEEVLIFTSFFRFVFVKNTGIAFSLPVPLWIVIGATIGILLFLVMYGRKHGFSWGYSLIGVGAVGNLIDRLWHGYVIDFISIGSFPVFNVADICVSVGLGLLLLQEFKKSKKS